MLMNKGRFVALIIGCATICLIVTMVLACSKTNRVQLSFEMQKALDEANRDFTFQGKPIHPDVVREFEICISDNVSPVTVSVDIAAADKACNEYNADIVVTDEGRVRVIDSDEGGYYDYERIGTLDNGLHVLHTYDCGGGSGVFENLFLVRFSSDIAYDENGKSYERLLMTVAGVFSLGDRGDGCVKVHADSVIISPSKYRPESTVLNFE